MTNSHFIVLDNQQAVIEGSFTEKNSIIFNVAGKEVSTFFNTDGTGELASCVNCQLREEISDISFF